MKTDLVSTAKEIILEGAKIGLDIAGENLLGPAGWKAFKKVLSPVVKRLKKRFPALTFGWECKIIYLVMVKKFNSSFKTLQHLLRFALPKVSAGFIHIIITKF